MSLCRFCKTTTLLLIAQEDMFEQKDDYNAHNKAVADYRTNDFGNGSNCALRSEGHHNIKEQGQSDNHTVAELGNATR